MTPAGEAHTNGALPQETELSAQAAPGNEEESIENVAASMTVAEVAAAAAAQAAAMAEASSATTREARSNAQQAEENLQRVREAIQCGALGGEDAEMSLHTAEDAYTQAQATLADAEAAEEQAIQAARSAEVEATVAEGRASLDGHIIEAVDGEQTQE